MSNLESYKNKFSRLNVRKVGGEYAPHKPCLILAVIDQMETTASEENCFKYEPQLLANYDRYFRVLRPLERLTNARHPFVFLVSDGFWHLYDHQGEYLNYTPEDARILDSRGLTKFLDTVEHVTLDDNLFDLLRDSEARTQLRQTLIQKWFPDDKEARLWNEIREIRTLNKDFDIEISAAQMDEISEYWRKVINYRDPNFRSRVLKAYNYRCAATGWQLKVRSLSNDKPAQDSTTLLEAAHIMPVSDSRNNRINNGIALTPTLHLAMDSHLIAPGPDLLWHVSDLVLEQVESDEGARQISELQGEPIKLPNNPMLGPTQSILEWSIERLLKIRT